MKFKNDKACEAGELEIITKNEKHLTDGVIKSFYGEDPTVWEGEE